MYLDGWVWESSGSVVSYILTVHTGNTLRYVSIPPFLYRYRWYTYRFRYTDICSTTLQFKTIYCCLSWLRGLTGLHWMFPTGVSHEAALRQMGQSHQNIRHPRWLEKQPHSLCFCILYALIQDNLFWIHLAFKNLHIFVHQ